MKDIETRRRSDRVYRELTIRVSGTDGKGQSFMEETCTLVLSRHGAKILLTRTLFPNQELTIRCHESGKESLARVVGRIGGDEEGSYYGMELLERESRIWGIEFPSADDAEMAAGRVLLACGSCHAQELAYLDEFALEVLLANQRLSRLCKRCGETTLWQETAAREGRETPSPAKLGAGLQPGQERRTRNDRRYVRVGLKVNACIRHSQGGEEVVPTINVSRGGFRFTSRTHCPVGSLIDAALPFTRDAANIFAPGRIVYAGEAPGEGGMRVYGVAYLPLRK
jgi:hypothetical protein